MPGIGGKLGTGGTTTGAGGTVNPGSGGRGTGGTIGAGGSITDGGVDRSDVAGTGGGGSGVGGGGVGGMGTGGMGVGGMGTGGMGTGGMATGGNGGVYPPPTMAGQVVITEIMADSAGPPDDMGEWFELYNPTNQTFDLKGCALFDTAATNTDEVLTHVIIAPGAYVTMARFGDVSGGFSPTYNYHTTLLPGGGLNPNADVKFSNMGDRVGITCGVTPIDVVNFSTADWLLLTTQAPTPQVPHGRTYSLDPTRLNAVDNDNPQNWCTGGPAVYPLPAGPDHGTPGIANPPCTCALLACPWL